MSHILLDGLVRACGAFAFTLCAFPCVTWLENIRGASTTGLPHATSSAKLTLARAIKLLERRTPRAEGADRPLHAVAPLLAVIPAMSVVGMMPVVPRDPVSSTVPLVLGLSLLSTGAVALAGFSGGSSLALLAALRLAALRLSVLVVVATAALAPIRLARSLELPAVVDAQSTSLVSVLPRWGVFVAPTTFIAAVVAIAVLAQHVLRARTEPSLTVAWLGDAAGPILLGHRIFETIDLLAHACLVAVLFLGGWHLPTLESVPVVVTIAKGAFALAAIVVARNALPQLTHAVALRVCWVVLLPLAVVGLALMDAR